MKNSISVLMAIYYKENPDYFQQAMESIWDKQTLKPYEIVLVEDGKLTKELYDVINNWKVKLCEKLKLIILKENEGLTKALNIGIDHCTCEFIARMDSDDISLPFRFEKQVLFLEKNKNIMVLGTYVQEFTTNKIVTFPITDKCVRKVIAKSSPLAHPTIMMRKSVFESGIHYREKYRTSQDLALWFDIISEGYKIANIPEPLLLYRRTKDTYLKRRKKAFNEFRIFVIGIWKLNGLSLKLVFPFFRLIARLLPTIFIRTLYNNKFNIYLMNFLKR